MEEKKAKKAAPKRWKKNYFIPGIGYTGKREVTKADRDVCKEQDIDINLHIQ
jgi:hypothetical protein